MPRKEIYQKNIEKLREYNRIYLRKWRAANPDKVAVPSKKYRNKYMKKYLKSPVNNLKQIARGKTAYQIKKGHLVRGDCRVNSCKLPTEAHHDDYTKPLSIVWLCKKHHEEYHHGTINS